MYQLLLTRRYVTSKIMPLLAAAAVALCTAMVLIVWSVMGGFLSMLLSSGRTLTGDVVIEWSTGIGHYQELVDRLQEEDLVEAASPSIQTFGLLGLPGGRVEMVVVRGIEGESYARVTSYGELLWWRPTDKPMPRDRERADPRLDPEAQQNLARMLRNGLSLTRPDGPDRQEDEGSVAVRPARPAMVLGIAVSGLSRRVAEAGFYVPRAPFLPMQGSVTLNVVPLDRSGRVIEMATREFPVANEFQSGIYEVDRSTVFVEFAALQKMLQMDEAQRLSGATGVRVVIDPVTGAERFERVGTTAGMAPARATHVLVRGKEDVLDGAALERLRRAVEQCYARFAREHDGEVPDEFSIDIRTWEDQNRTMIAAVKKETALVLFLFSLISLTAVFLVLAIFWSMISEKTKDIGILRAVGASTKGVAMMWITYGAALGLLGASVGVALAYGIVLNINPIHDWIIEVGQRFDKSWGGIWDPRIYYFTEIPSKVEPARALIVYAGGVLSAVVGSLVPAVRAAAMHPVRALRFE